MCRNVEKIRGLICSDPTLYCSFRSCIYRLIFLFSHGVDALLSGCFGAFVWWRFGSSLQHWTLAVDRARHAFLNVLRLACSSPDGPDDVVFASHDMIRGYASVDAIVGTPLMSKYRGAADIGGAPQTSEVRSH